MDKIYISICRLVEFLWAKQSGADEPERSPINTFTCTDLYELYLGSSLVTHVRGALRKAGVGFQCLYLSPSESLCGLSWLISILFGMSRKSRPLWCNSEQCARCCEPRWSATRDASVEQRETEIAQEYDVSVIEYEKW